MANPNQISVQIPAPVLADCLAKANDIATALEPYLAGLDEEDRHDLFKLGDKSVGYLQKLLGYVDSAPQHVPSYMDVAEFKKDAQVAVDLQPLFQVLAPLVQKIEDTRMLGGSEAMVAGKGYYGTVGLAAKAGAPGARAIYDDLSIRFPGRKGSKGKEEDKQEEAKSGGE